MLRVQGHRAYARDPSIQSIPTLRPEAFKYNRHWAIWIAGVAFLRPFLAWGFVSWRLVRRANGRGLQIEVLRLRVYISLLRGVVGQGV